MIALDDENGRRRPSESCAKRLRDVLLAGREASEEEALLLGLLEPLGLIDSLVTRSLGPTHVRA